MSFQWLCIQRGFEEVHISRLFLRTVRPHQFNTHIGLIHHVRVLLQVLMQSGSWEDEIQGR